MDFMVGSKYSGGFKRVHQRWTLLDLENMLWVTCILYNNTL